MSRPLMTRRRFLSTGLAAGFAASPLLRASHAIAEITARFHAVAVDVSPMERYGGAAVGDVLRGVLLGEMRKVFADRLDPRDAAAPVLTARVSAFFLAAYDGTQRIDALGGNDSIEGDGIVTGRGAVLSTTHILTELPPTYSGSLVTADLEVVRCQSIAYQFAYWLRREMGL